MDTITRPKRSASPAEARGLTDRRADARAAGRRLAARIGLGIILAAAAVTAYNAWPRHAPTWVKAPRADGPTVRVGAPPTSYRIVWRVDAGNPVGTAVRTETFEVNRPWQSRLTTREGKPPGKVVSDVQQSDFGKLVLRPTDEAETVLVVQPDLAASDLRLDVDLDALVRARGVEVRERRKIAGEPCQVYRTTAPLQGQTIGTVPSKSGDIVDSCVDRHGLILEQLIWFRDKLLLRRRATSVDLHPRIGRHELDVKSKATVPTSMGGGAIGEVEAKDLPKGSYVLDAPPTGFRLKGHYAVAPSAPPSSNGTPTANRRSSFVDVWTNGVDALLLDQGGLTFKGDALGPNPLSAPVDLGPLGSGRSAPGARFSQVAITRKDGTFVRLLGTLPVSRLVELMKMLRRTG
ncbi:MAG: hypothetical protein V7636_347 [Actinomycetota bacterium]|jgi:hypothetical protein